MQECRSDATLRSADNSAACISPIKVPRLRSKIQTFQLNNLLTNSPTHFKYKLGTLNHYVHVISVIGREQGYFIEKNILFGSIIGISAILFVSLRWKILEMYA